MSITVKIEDLKNEEEFIPYKVTFFINNQEEARTFHDQVAIKICNGCHNFIGNIYQRNHGEISGNYEDVI